MNKANIKLEFVCKICNQILKEPILLPCHHAAICQMHLNISLATFKCRKCGNIYKFADISNEIDATLQARLYEGEYLSDDEKQIKKQLYDRLNEIECKQEEFCQAFYKLELDSHENFAEMRRLIDLQHEEEEEEDESKDLIAQYLQMIKDIQQAENLFQQILNEKFRPNLNIDGEFNVESQRSMLGEIFRQIDVSVSRLEKLDAETYERTLENVKSKQIDLDRLHAQIKECKYEKSERKLNLEAVNDLIKMSQTKRMLTCSGDQTIKVWDLKNGKCLNTFGYVGKNLNGHVYLKNIFLFLLKIQPKGLKRIISGIFRRYLKNVFKCSFFF